MVATAEWVHWYGHHSPSLRYRHAYPRRARSRLGTRPPPPRTITTGNHRHQINQSPQNPGLDMGCQDGWCWIVLPTGKGFAAMTHRNAVLTPQGRYRLVMRVRAGRPIAHVVAEAGIN